MNKLTTHTEEVGEKYSLDEIKSVVDLFQSLHNVGVDDSTAYQTITNVLGQDMEKIMKIIHYYKAAEKDRHIAVYDDFTIYDATLWWLENPEEYCKTNQYPLWHP